MPIYGKCSDCGHETENHVCYRCVVGKLKEANKKLEAALKAITESYRMAQEESCNELCWEKFNSNGEIRTAKELIRG